MIILGYAQNLVHRLDPKAEQSKHSTPDAMNTKLRRNHNKRMKSHKKMMGRAGFMSSPSIVTVRSETSQNRRGASPVVPPGVPAGVPGRTGSVPQARDPARRREPVEQKTAPLQAPNRRAAPTPAVQLLAPRPSPVSQEIDSPRQPQRGWNSQSSPSLKSDSWFQLGLMGQQNIAIT